MAFFPGEGSEMTQPIGQTILGGLSFGTLMTLFLMPVLYFGFNRIREKREEKKLLKARMRLEAREAKLGGNR
jgi:HAE1 family hydrophobic/amphiphilic exporter-1